MKTKIFKNLLMQHICIWFRGYYFPKKLYGDNSVVYTREGSWYRNVNVRRYNVSSDHVKENVLVEWKNFKYRILYGMELSVFFQNIIDSKPGRIMTRKFKVDDLVYCTKTKMFGYITYVSKHNHFAGIYFRYEECQSLPYHWISGKRNTVFKVVKLNTELAFDFANYCIGEGFTSNATKRDLVNFLNSRK